MTTELDKPTIARVMPMKIKRWNGFSVPNASPIEAKLPYIRLNRQTPCPPRRAVPVNQGFTRDTRIAFGHGGGRPSYVRTKYNFIQIICNSDRFPSTDRAGRVMTGLGE